MTKNGTDSLDLIVVAQTAITESLAAHAKTMANQSETLKDISKTLTAICVDQARAEERIVSILENNQRIEIAVSTVCSRVRNLEDKTTATGVVIGSARMHFASLVSTFVAGGGLVYVCLTIIAKGGV